MAIVAVPPELDTDSGSGFAPGDLSESTGTVEDAQLQRRFDHIGEVEAVCTDIGLDPGVARRDDHGWSFRPLAEDFGVGLGDHGFVPIHEIAL